jgi:hypothetical protein
MHFAGIFLKIIIVTLFLTNHSFSQNPTNNYPVYKDGKLTIPRVDSDAQASNYQDVELQFDNATNTWKLLNYREAKIIPEQGVYLKSVEVITSNTSPVQVFLKISGDLPTPCNEFGQINQQLKANTFEITMHLAPSVVLCAQVLEPFTKIIPLEVYGLPAGTYVYSVNGEHTGSFTLTEDNTL